MTAAKQIYVVDHRIVVLSRRSPFARAAGNIIMGASGAIRKMTMGLMRRGIGVKIGKDANRCVAGLGELGDLHRPG